MMSNSSSKLMNTVMCINILRDANHEALDLYLQRGGWDMVLGWTVNAYSTKDFPLLKEIGEFLLKAPASIQRLKQNELPKVVKTLSKDCDNEEIRKLAKQVVIKWIAIVKQQHSEDDPAQINNCKNMQVDNPIGTQDSSTHEIPVNYFASSSIKFASSIVGENETTTTAAQFDVSTFDINEAEMMDFNPEDLEKAVDQHLGDCAITNPNSSNSNNDSQIIQVSDNQAVGMEISTSHQIKAEMAENHIPSTCDSESSRAPIFLIKTATGSAVVQSVAIHETNQEKTPYYITVNDGKPVLVRLKSPSPSEVDMISITHRNQEGRANSPPSPEVEKKRRPSISTKKLHLTQKGHPRPETSSPRVKNKPLDKEVKDKSEEKKPSSSGKKHHSGSKLGSVAAAAAAKKYSEEDKLRDKIQLEKVMLKKRAKEAAKQKQRDKDQEVLKKLNLSNAAAPATKFGTNSPIFMKIPKKQSSFSDAIGIPFASEGADKFAREKKAANKQSSIKVSESSSVPELSATRFYGKKEDVTKADNTQEKRHRVVKVFNTKTSRNDDLLKEMTETVKNNKSNKVESINKGNQYNLSALMTVGEKSLAGNSLILKPEKRPSVDGIEKPGDVKKQKLSSSESEEKSDKKKEPKEGGSKLSKEKANANAAGVMKESSLFMDTLAASTEVQKPISKRKPALGLNRETTLGDQSPTDEKTKPRTCSFVEDGMDVEILENNAATDETNTIDAFTPTQDELRLKSALILHHSRYKPKKYVRFRDEDELKEIFEFELDVTERANVSKKKDVISMKKHDKAEEKMFLAKNLTTTMLGSASDETEEKMPWRMIPILIESERRVPCISEEKDTQEERERINLGVFLPPGFALPETPLEPDPISPSDAYRGETKNIPSEDVINVTNSVVDNRAVPWPHPKGLSIGSRPPKPFGLPIGSRPPKPFGLPIGSRPPKPFGLPIGSRPPKPFGLVQRSTEQPNFGITNFNMPPELALRHPSAIPPGFPPPVPNSSSHLNNPWRLQGVSLQASPNTSSTRVNDVMTEEEKHWEQRMKMMGPSGAIRFPSMTDQYRKFGNLPTTGLPAMPNPNQMTPNINMNREDRDIHQSGLQNSKQGRGGGSTSGRDFGNRDGIRSFKDSKESRDSRARDYAKGTRSRDYRSRDYDRDRRSPSPSRKRRDGRDRERHSRDDKDYRDHDNRSRTKSGIEKKNVPCRFFKKNNCKSGSQCEFSHGNPPGVSKDRSKSDNTRSRHSSPSLMDEDDKSSNIALSSIEFQYERREPSREEATKSNDSPRLPTDEIQKTPSPSLKKVGEPASIITIE